MTQGTYVLPLGESSLERLGNALPAGVVIGARGDHYFLHPQYKDDPAFKDFVTRFHDKTGAYPIYPAFHMAQALAALQKAYDGAAKANGGQWPTKEQVLDAFRDMKFRGLTSEVSIRDDHQGLENQLIGTTVRVPDYPFAVLDKIAIYPGALVTTPVGQKSAEWLAKLNPAMVNDPSILTFNTAK